jgi:hypothetical protein
LGRSATNGSRARAPTFDDRSTVIEQRLVSADAPFEFRQPRRQFGLVGDPRSKPEKRSDHKHAHLDRKRAVENGGRHDCAVLCERQRCVLDMLAAL